MTLILALVGEGEAILAAESKSTPGDSGGLYSTNDFAKLRVVTKNQWIIGCAVTSTGLDLYEYIERKGYVFNADINFGAYEYANKMKELYVELECTGETILFLAGISRDRAAIYTWTLGRKPSEREPNGYVTFTGACPVQGKHAIGANSHGAMYFAHAFHSSSLNTIQRITLGHFCVSEASKLDPRCGPPVRVGLVRVGHPPLILNAEDLINVAARGEEISKQIGSLINSSSPKISCL